MGHLIGPHIRMGVVPLGHTGAFDEGFSSDCDVISGSHRGHSRVGVMSPRNHCRVTARPQAQIIPTVILKLKCLTGRIERIDLQGIIHIQAVREMTRIRAHANALNCISSPRTNEETQGNQSRREESSSHHLKEMIISF